MRELDEASGSSNMTLLLASKYGLLGVLQVHRTWHHAQIRHNSSMQNKLPTMCDTDTLAQVKRASLHPARCKYIEKTQKRMSRFREVSARYVRTPQGSRKYRRFPGERPTSACAKVQGREDCEKLRPRCQWIADVTGAEYCRGRSRSVSSKVSFGRSLLRKTPRSRCSGLDRKDCTSASACAWVTDMLGREYCRGKAPSLSAEALEGRARPQGFSLSGRFDPALYSRENKASWYQDAHDLTEEQKKHCRCILYQMARDLFTHGYWVHNPYAICTFTLPAARLRGKAEADLRAINARTARYGLCTKGLDFDRLPIELTYAWLAYHADHGTKRFLLRKLPIPSVQQFLAAPAKYEWLREVAKDLVEEESPTVQGRTRARTFASTASSRLR